MYNCCTHTYTLHTSLNHCISDLWRWNRCSLSYTNWILISRSSSFAIKFCYFVFYNQLCLELQRLEHYLVSDRYVELTFISIYTSSISQQGVRPSLIIPQYTGFLESFSVYLIFFQRTKTLFIGQFLLDNNNSALLVSFFQITITLFYWSVSSR